MIILKKLFSRNRKNFDDNPIDQSIDQFSEIGNLVKEARLQKNLTIDELSCLSKIPVYILNSIENNVENHRPKNPFIRSILFKLEACLSLKKNTLVDLIIKEEKTFKKDKKNFLVRKFDFINTWEGSILYFLLLILTIFCLKRYFISDMTIIEIQTIEEKVK